MAGFAIGLVAHDYKTAMEVIDRALGLTGASAQALWMGAVVLAHAGESAKAIDYAERSLRLTPVGRDSSSPLIALAIAHSATGNFEAAVTASANSAQANPRFSLAHALQAAGLYRLGRIEEAKAVSRRGAACWTQFHAASFATSDTRTGEPRSVGITTAS